MTAKCTESNICPNTKTRSHKIVGKGVVTCIKCKVSWCCMECAVLCDMLDHHYFDMIYEHEPGVPTPAVHKIVCCGCSGKKPSWADRDD